MVRRNHIQLPANIFLILKTMTMVQSLGMGLEPNFNFFKVIAPYVEGMFKKKYAPSAILRRLPPTVAELAIFGTELPRRLNRFVKSVERGELQIRANASGLEQHLEHLERIINRMIEPVS